MNRDEFSRRQHDQVRETLEKLREHMMAFEEKLQEGGEAEEWQPLLDEARAGVSALEPVLEDYDNAGVDSEELIQYAQAIEERLKQEPADDEMRDALEDVEEVLETLAPLLTVDDEDLVKYEDTLAELTEKEIALAARLER